MIQPEGVTQPDGVTQPKGVGREVDLHILTIDASSAQCSVTLVRNGVLVAAREATGGRGQSALLAPMVEAVLAEAGQNPLSLDAVAVTVGPGSFTGLRAALALAHGLGAAGIAVVGVTVAEALAAQVGAQLPPLGDRVLWTAIDSRRGRVFLDTPDGLRSVAIAELQAPAAPLAIAGDAAGAVADRLAAQGCDVLLTDARVPQGVAIAAAAESRLAGRLKPLAAQPLYVDPPEASLPAGGLRPPPQPEIVVTTTW